MKKQNNNVILGIIIFTFLAIGGCKKKDNTPPPVINGKVKSMNWVWGGNVTTDYTYDSQGRLTMSQDNNHTTGSVIKNIYTYGTNSVIIQTINGTSQSTKVYNLNAQGYIINGDSTNYNYDNEGHCIYSSNSYSTYTYTYTNGNMITDVETYNGTTYTYTYTFLTDKTDYRDNGMKFYGNGSKNLVNYMTRTPSQSPPNPDITTLTYEYDSKGRVTKETGLNTSSYTTTTTFTYFD